MKSFQDLHNVDASSHFIVHPSLSSDFGRGVCMYLFIHKINKKTFFIDFNLNVYINKISIMASDNHKTFKEILVKVCLLKK